MQKIKKNDIVQITKGKDKGKKGKVITVFAQRKCILVEGLNLVKKHKRQTRQDQQGGIVSIEAPLNMSNAMVFCKTCARGVRVGFSVAGDGKKSRVCKTCKEVI